MKRRDFLALSAASSAAPLLRGVLPGAGAARAADVPAAKRPPNVVLIISDDQHWGDFGFLGHKHVRTPHLDRLAAQSLVFTRGYVPTSLCRPSLATMVTGLYPHQHKVVGNDPKGGHRNTPGRNAMIARIEERPTVPKVLGELGYLSHQSGKWWEGNHRQGGFTHGMTHGDVKRGGRHGDVGLQIGRKGMKPVTDFIDMAVGKGKAFFVWYAPFLPHTPHTPPKDILGRYTKLTDSPFVAKYWAMCEWFDRTCGQLLKHLDDRKVAENTLVLFLIDNGWIQKPKARGGDFTRSKRSPYDGGVRTPIMVRWPGRAKPRRDERHLAHSIDLAPTIYAACGAKAPAGLPGVNLLDAEAVAGRDALFGEIYEHDIVDLARPESGLRYRWCVEGEWKLILPNARRLKDAKPALYHVTEDPHEKTDLASEHPEKVKHLTQRIEAWWKETS